MAIKMQMFWRERACGQGMVRPIARLSLHLQDAAGFAQHPVQAKGWGVSLPCIWQMKLTWDPDPELFLTEVLFSLCQRGRV